MPSKQPPPLPDSPAGSPAAGAIASQSDRPSQTPSGTPADSKDSSTRSWARQPLPGDSPSDPAAERAETAQSASGDAVRSTRGWKKLLPTRVKVPKQIGGWLLSLVIHATVLVVLGLWIDHTVRQIAKE